MNSNNIYKMKKQILLDALKRSNFDVSKAIAHYPEAGIFTSRRDIDMAFQSADHTLERWKSNKKTGDVPIPNTPEEFIKSIDIDIAESIFLWAISRVGSKLRDKSNKEYVEDMRAAIKELDRLGCDGKAYYYTLMMNRKIGEE